MKPYIHGTIIFAGFFVAAGTASIVAAEYQLVATRGAAVASIFKPAREQAPQAVAARYIWTQDDSDLYGSDWQARMKSELKPAVAPEVEIKVDSQPSKCPEAEARKARAVRLREARAPRAELALESPASPATPPSSQQLVALNIPSMYQEADVPEAAFKFEVAGKDKAMFAIEGLPKECKFKFDSKMFAVDQKRWAMDMKAVALHDKTWTQMSDKDLKKLKATFPRLSQFITVNGGSTVIHIDPKAIEDEIKAAEKAKKADADAYSAPEADVIVGAN